MVKAQMWTAIFTEFRFGVQVHPSEEWIPTSRVRTTPDGQLILTRLHDPAERTLMDRVKDTKRVDVWMLPRSSDCTVPRMVRAYVAQEWRGLGAPPEHCSIVPPVWMPLDLDATTDDVACESVALTIQRYEVQDLSLIHISEPTRPY